MNSVDLKIIPDTSVTGDLAKCSLPSDLVTLDSHNLIRPHGPRENNLKDVSCSICHPSSSNSVSLT